VTNADGSTTVMTLAALGITEINLTANTVNIELPDGSVITGQTTFTRANGTVGTVANTTLTADAAGYRVVETAAINFAGERVLTQTGYDKDGGVAFRVISFTIPSGTASLRMYDDNGDGVTDRVQRIDRATNGDGPKVETMVNRLGADRYRTAWLWSEDRRGFCRPGCAGLCLHAGSVPGTDGHSSPARRHRGMGGRTGHQACAVNLAGMTPAQAER
jgi:hypothetical protein